MQIHLYSGCSRCNKVLKVWQEVRAMAAREPGCEPPADAVLFVKNAWRHDKAATSFPGKAVMARLISDSFRRPLPAGVRGCHQLARQIACKAGVLRVDVLIEPLVTSKRFALTGQVLDTTSPDRDLNGVTVKLFCEGRCISRAVSNQFGEFCFVFETVGRLQLELALPGKDTVIVALQGSEPDVE